MNLEKNIISSPSSHFQGSEVLYQKNLMAIRNRFPVSADFLEKSEVGNNVQKNNKGEIVVSLFGEYVLNNIFPRVEGFKRASKLYEGEDTASIIVCAGLSPVYHVQAILENTKSLVIAYEPAIESLKAVMYLVDLTHIIQDKRFLLMSTLAEVKDFITRHFTHKDSLDLFILPAYVKKYKKIMSLLSYYLRSETALSKANMISHVALAKPMTENTMKNLSKIITSPDIEILRNTFKDYPIAVVGAGPSLEISLPFLKEYQSSIIIICIDVALKALKNNGIVPHLVVTLEKNDFCWRTIQEIGAENTSLLVSNASNHNVFHLDTQNIFTVFVDSCIVHQELAPYLKRSIIPAYATVSTLAFSAALIIGGNPIILCGQDLAFTGKKIYSQSTLLGDQNIRNNIELWKKKNPLSLTYKQRLLIEPKNGSFLTEADRISRDKILDLISKEKILEPLILEDYLHAPDIYKEFIEILRKNSFVPEEYIFTLTESAYLSALATESRKNSKIKAIGYQGEYLETSEAYQAVNKWFSFQSEKLKEEMPNQQLFNFSHGAKIEGIPFIEENELQKLIQKRELDTRSILSKSKYVEPEIASLSHHWLKEKEIEVTKMYHLIKSALKATKTLITQFRSKDTGRQKWFQQFRQSHEEINQMLSKSRLIYSFMYQERLLLEEKVGKIQKGTKGEIEVYHDYYQELYKQIKELSELIKHTQQ